jgi:hypothetical protein
MPLEVRQVHCPNCGAPLDILNARRSKTIVCGACRSQLDLTDPTLRVVADLANRRAVPRTPIGLGMYGEFRGQRWQVIGRIRYREDGAFWDEWLLMTDEGEFLWLTEGEEGFTLYDPVVPSEPIDPDRVLVTVTFEGVRYAVRARGTGTVDFLEGELTWTATVGDRVRYLDAQLGQTKFAIEWTPSEIEYFRGEKLAANVVRQAFGLPPVSGLSLAGAGRRISVFPLFLTVVILICVCGFLALVAAPGESDDDGGGSGIVFVPFPGGSGGSGGGFGGSSRGGGGSGSRSGGGGK